MMPVKDIPLNDLIEFARQVRLDIVFQTNKAGSGHPGGPLSATDFSTVLYKSIMNYNPKDPRWPERDMFIMSKGHCSALLYSLLARIGVIPPEWLETFRKTGSPLQGHPNMLKCPGVEVSTGSLGQGLSVGNGMALAMKLNGQTDRRVYVIAGDGEIQEGQYWEALMTSAHYNLDNVCLTVDVNGLQIDGTTREVMNLDPLPDKFRAFNWHVIEINGHSFEEAIDAYTEASQTKGKPTVVLALTTKGKGVSYMENQAGWHGRPPNDAEYAIAVKDINAMTYPW
ncbi:MAG: transketolase [bacterium]